LLLQQDISEGLFKFQLGGQKHWNVYTKSFLQFGHVSARIRYVTVLAQDAIVLSRNHQRHMKQRKMKRRQLITTLKMRNSNNNNNNNNNIGNQTDPYNLHEYQNRHDYDAAQPFIFEEDEPNSSSIDSRAAPYSMAAVTDADSQHNLHTPSHHSSPTTTTTTLPQSPLETQHHDEDISAMNYCFFAGYDEKVRPSSPDPYEKDVPYLDTKVLLFGPDTPFEDQFARCLDTLRPLLVKYNNNYCNIGKTRHDYDK
jgi:hypothetical protein